MIEYVTDNSNRNDEFTEYCGIFAQTKNSGNTETAVDSEWL
jgi:hypothetical protein